MEVRVGVSRMDEHWVSIQKAGHPFSVALLDAGKYSLRGWCGIFANGRLLATIIDLNRNN